MGLIALLTHRRGLGLSERFFQRCQLGQEGWRRSQMFESGGLKSFFNAMASSTRTTLVFFAAHDSAHPLRIFRRVAMAFRARLDMTATVTRINARMFRLVGDSLQVVRVYTGRCRAKMVDFFNWIERTNKVFVRQPMDLDESTITLMPCVPVQAARFRARPEPAVTLFAGLSCEEFFNGFSSFHDWDYSTTFPACVV